MYLPSLIDSLNKSLRWRGQIAPPNKLRNKYWLNTWYAQDHLIQFINSIQQIFIGHLPCVKYFSSCLGYNSEWNKKNPWLLWADIPGSNREVHINKEDKARRMGVWGAEQGSTLQIKQSSQGRPHSEKRSNTNLKKGVLPLLGLKEHSRQRKQSQQKPSEKRIWWILSEEAKLSSSQMRKGKSVWTIHHRSPNYIEAERPVRGSHSETDETYLVLPRGGGISEVRRSGQTLDIF